MNSWKADSRSLRGLRGFSNHRHPARRGKSNATPNNADGMAGCWSERYPRQHLSQNNLHFICGKGCAEAVADASTKRKESVGINTLANKPIRVKCLRFGPQLWSTMGKVNTRRSHAARRHVIVANPSRTFEIACDEWDNGVETCGFFDDCVKIFKL